ncbi:MAG: phosphatidate cytidylyltransferase [Roseburia sp.]|nr:phosphatidate cytidylyltransferase [Roseburia sp.]
MKKDRVVTGTFIAIVYVAVVLLALYVHPIFFDVFIFLLALGGAYEMSRALPKIMSEPILAIDLAEIVVSFGAFWFSQYFFKTYAAGIAAAFAVLVLAVVVTVIVTACSKTYVKGNAVSTVFIMLYPCSLLMFSLGLNYFMNFEVGIGVVSSLPYRSVGILLMFLVPALTDVFAYLVGSTLKGKKLCPSVSPNKTVSGAIGGLFGGMLGAGVILLLMYLAEKFSVDLFGLSMLTGGWTSTIINLLVLGLVGAVFDQIGDLGASFIKRRAGIKDYSNLLPGHGGVLDRVDGFIFCGVFFYMYFAVMVLL